MDWFRSWHGAPTDTKWLAIARRANVVPGIVSAVAWALLDCASQHTDRGSVADFDAETYAAFSGFAEEDIAAVLAALREKNIIDQYDRLTSWDKRQPKREDSSTQRVRAFRERNETQCNAEKRNETQCNAPDTDTDTDTEIVDDAERAAALAPGPTVARASTTRTVAVKPNAKLSPAVNAYAQLTGKFPPRALHHLIDAAMATRDDPDLLRRCYETWLSRGFRPENNAWLLEWYTSGAIPQSQNGNGRPPPVQAGYAIRYTDKGAFLPDGSQVE